MNKFTERERAIKLRMDGYSYNYIVEQVNVSKSTLHYWLADIPYIPNKETIKRIGIARAKSGETKSRQKRASIANARSEAQRDIKMLNNRDLFMLGLGLYIGEGSKTNNFIRIINSNPKVINLAIRWFEKVCGLTKKHFSLAIHLYPDNDIEGSLRYWSEITGIPIAQFGKTQVDKRKNKKMHKKGKLLHGTAHLNIRSCGNKKFGVFLSRKIGAWIDEVYKKAGVV